MEEEFLRHYNQDLFAKTALKVLYDRAQEDGDTFKILFKTRDALITKAPENIVLRNTTEAFLTKLSLHDIREESRKKYTKILSEMDSAEQELKTNTAKKIKSGKTIFIHSFNNQLIAAAEHVSRYKKATLRMIDHHPLKFGKRYYEDLKTRQRKAELFFDLAITKAIEGAALCLLGGDLITEEGNIIVKSGSKTVADTARKNNIPTYVCISSWKYDQKGQTKKHMLSYNNHNEKKGDFYEELPNSKITGIITEHGIFKPKKIIIEIKNFNKHFNH
ncbi:MAG: hypothetical protein AABW92_00910 [Nanoarchaeota archaeon]